MHVYIYVVLCEKTSASDSGRLGCAEHVHQNHVHAMEILDAFAFGSIRFFIKLCKFDIQLSVILTIDCCFNVIGQRDL